jgi:hypothetical protein
MHTYFTPARFTPAKPPAAQQPSSRHPHSTAVSSTGCISKAGAHALGIFYHEPASRLCGAAPGSAAASVLVSSRLPLATLTPSYTQPASTGQHYDIHDTPQQIHTATPLLHAGATLRARSCASSRAPGMPDVVSTHQSYAPRSAAV